MFYLRKWQIHGDLKLQFCRQTDRARAIRICERIVGDQSRCQCVHGWIDRSRSYYKLRLFFSFILCCVAWMSSNHSTKSHLICFGWNVHPTPTAVSPNNSRLSVDHLELQRPTWLACITFHVRAHKRTSNQLIESDDSLSFTALRCAVSPLPLPILNR